MSLRGYDGLRCQRLLIEHNTFSKSIRYSKHYHLKCNAIYITDIILVYDIQNGSKKMLQILVKIIK